MSKSLFGVIQQARAKRLFSSSSGRYSWERVIWWLYSPSNTFTLHIPQPPRWHPVGNGIKRSRAALNGVTFGAQSYSKFWFLASSVTLYIISLLHTLCIIFNLNHVSAFANDSDNSLRW